MARVGSIRRGYDRGPAVKTGSVIAASAAPTRVPNPRQPATRRVVGLAPHLRPPRSMQGTGAHGAALFRHLRRRGVVVGEVDRPDRAAKR